MNILKIFLGGKLNFNFYISLHMSCVQISLLHNKPATKLFFLRNAIECKIINKKTKSHKEFL